MLRLPARVDGRLRNMMMVVGECAMNINKDKLAAGGCMRLAVRRLEGR